MGYFKIFYSIFGTDWELAMSYAIAHYATLISQQVQAPSGDSLGEIAGGGVTRGVLTNATIGNFSKTYDLTKTMLDSQEAMFWNQTSYGTSLMALLKTKAINGKRANHKLSVYIPNETADYIYAGDVISFSCTLEEIDKENGHPTELGMKQISGQVSKCLG